MRIYAKIKVCRCDVNRTGLGEFGVSHEWRVLKKVIIS